MVFSLHNQTKLLKARKRIGRGGCRGGSCGKGQRGQKSRSGGAKGGIFEGGQMPLARRLPKRGFNNLRFQEEVVIFNVGQLGKLFEDGQEITRQALVERGLLRSGNSATIKVLGGGDLDKKLVVHADAFSSSAKAALEAKGGAAHLTKER
ncbi:MAG: 50S ribosomal protein L15 [candidate division TM6 bacterium GW2011_GWF2_43_17]|nr:MAG: 50S ribosomal protein L15 [candidate division TM6 bacterium GW2011_GWF2_43_17]HAU30126.1 50S ribosomal protein L15 [Candidatus Dependentiae bacterium]